MMPQEAKLFHVMYAAITRTLAISFAIGALSALPKSPTATPPTFLKIDGSQRAKSRSHHLKENPVVAEGTTGIWRILAATNSMAATLSAQ